MLQKNSDANSSSLLNNRGSNNDDSKFLVALDRCISNDAKPNAKGIKANILLAMYLIEVYLRTPGYDKMKLFTFIRKHLAAFLQDNVVNFYGNSLLHVLVSAYDIENEFIDLIALLKKQYNNLVQWDYLDQSGKTAAAVALHDKALPVYRALEAITNVSEVVSIPGLENYEILENWDTFAAGKTSQQLINHIKSNVAAGKLKIAMSMVYGYLQDQKQDQAALLHAIHKNLHIFLRQDALTPNGYSILHLLAMFKGEQAEPAARLMESLFNSFQYLRDNVNNIRDKDDATILHIAVSYRNKDAAAVLKKRGADHTLVGGKEKTTAEVIATQIDQAKPEAQKILTKIVTGQSANQIKPMPNLFNSNENDDNAAVDVIFKLLEIKQYRAAAGVLTEYLQNKDDQEKIDRITAYIKKPGMKTLWKDFFIAETAVNFGKGNLLSIFATGNYNDNEAKAALKLLDDALDHLTEERRKEMLQGRDSLSTTALGNVIKRNNKNSPYFAALFVMHGADINRQEAYSQTPVQLVDSIRDSNFRDTMREAIERPEKFESSWKNNGIWSYFSK